MKSKEEENNSDLSGSEDEIDYANSDLIKCRYYRNVVPAKDDMVAVITVDIKDLGAYVRLLEYDNIEGFIMLSQVTAKRVRSVHKFLKIGKQEMMEVLRVDEEKMCIDLSKKSIKPEATHLATKRYKKAKQVHTIMRQVAIKLQTPVQELYEAWGWDLYDKFDHAFDAFRIALSDPDAVFARINISDQHKEVLQETIRRKMASNPLKIRADFALTCTNFDGVDVIREALLTAKHAVCDDVWKVEFKMIAPPNYKVEVMTHQRAEGEEKLKAALAIIKDVMKKKGGHFKQKSEPTVIGYRKDEPDVADLIYNLQARGEGEEDSQEDDEDNEEGMDVDLDELAGDVPDAISDEEESKEQ